MGELQAHDLVMEASKEVVKALELHALLAVLPKEVQVKPPVAVSTEMKAWHELILLCTG